MIRKIGVTDTTFARGDMGGLAVKTLLEHAKKRGWEIQVVRYTVPGVKDLPVANKMLLTNEKCDLAVSLGMVGREPVDAVCGHEASTGNIAVQVQTGKHVIEVFVHENEARGSEEKLAQIMRHRTVEHCINALELLFDQQALTKRAGTGKRQGGPDASFIKLF